MVLFEDLLGCWTGSPKTFFAGVAKTSSSNTARNPRGIALSCR